MFVLNLIYILFFFLLILDFLMHHSIVLVTMAMLFLDDRLHLFLLDHLHILVWNLCLPVIMFSFHIYLISALYMLQNLLLLFLLNNPVLCLVNLMQIIGLVLFWHLLTHHIGIHLCCYRMIFQMTFCILLPYRHIESLILFCSNVLQYLSWHIVHYTIVHLFQQFFHSLELLVFHLPVHPSMYFVLLVFLLRLDSLFYPSKYHFHLSQFHQYMLLLFFLVYQIFFLQQNCSCLCTSSIFQLLQLIVMLHLHYWTMAYRHIH